MKKFWMVWNEGNRSPVLKYLTDKDARREAERLVSLSPPGNVFIVLESIAEVQRDGFTWKQHIDIELEEVRE